MKVLFKTPTGSRLYGLAHAGSDYDYYTVVDKVKTKKSSYSTHTIIDGVDSVVVDFGTWINLCQSGVPQALEAMFSQYAEYDEISEFRAGFRAGTDYSKYVRTIKALALHEPTDMKHRRHAYRLATNLIDLRRYNRFNPTLTKTQADYITELATEFGPEACYRKALDGAFR